jgi:heat shock protein HslJ
MKRILFYTIAVVMTCGMSSCKCSQKNAKSETEAADNLTNKRWKLVEIMGRPVTYSADDGREAYIQFKSDGTVSGNLGCNTFTGNYAVPNPLQIGFSNLVNTLKMCLDMEIENELSQALKTADNYNVNGDQLVLNRARMAPLARFEAVYLQ